MCYSVINLPSVSESRKATPQFFATVAHRGGGFFIGATVNYEPRIVCAVCDSTISGTSRRIVAGLCQRCERLAEAIAHIAYQTTTCRIIPLSAGALSTIDSADYSRVTQHKWSLKTTYKRSGFPAHQYAYRNAGNGRTELLHRFITECPPELEVDHENGNGLDNRRENLRICNRRQNGANRGPSPANTSGFKGVVNYGTHFVAYVGARHQQSRYVGCFRTAEAAARAYDEEARRIWGEFAYQNFPTT